MNIDPSNVNKGLSCNPLHPAVESSSEPSPTLALPAEIREKIFSFDLGAQKLMALAMPEFRDDVIAGGLLARRHKIEQWVEGLQKELQELEIDPAVLQQLQDCFNSSPLTGGFTVEKWTYPQFDKELALLKDSLAMALAKAPSNKVYYLLKNYQSEAEGLNDVFELAAAYIELNGFNPYLNGDYSPDSSTKAPFYKMGQYGADVDWVIEKAFSRGQEFAQEVLKSALEGYAERGAIKEAVKVLNQLDQEQLKELLRSAAMVSSYEHGYRMEVRNEERFSFFGICESVMEYAICARLKEHLILGDKEGARNFIKNYKKDEKLLRFIKSSPILDDYFKNFTGGFWRTDAPGLYLGMLTYLGYPLETIREEKGRFSLDSKKYFHYTHDTDRYAKSILGSAPAKTPWYRDPAKISEQPAGDQVRMLADMGKFEEAKLKIYEVNPKGSLSKLSEVYEFMIKDDCRKGDIEGARKHIEEIKEEWQKVRLQKENPTITPPSWWLDRLDRIITVAEVSMGKDIPVDQRQEFVLNPGAEFIYQADGSWFNFDWSLWTNGAFTYHDALKGDYSAALRGLEENRAGMVRGDRVIGQAGDGHGHVVFRHIDTDDKGYSDRLGWAVADIMARDKTVSKKHAEQLFDQFWPTYCVVMKDRFNIIRDRVQDSVGDWAGTTDEPHGDMDPFSFMVRDVRGRVSAFVGRVWPFSRFSR